MNAHTNSTNRDTTTNVYRYISNKTSLKPYQLVTRHTADIRDDNKDGDDKEQETRPTIRQEDEHVSQPIHLHNMVLTATQEEDQILTLDLDSAGHVYPKYQVTDYQFHGKKMALYNMLDFFFDTYEEDIPKHKQDGTTEDESDN
jgi:hypothetical protein